MQNTTAIREQSQRNDTSTEHWLGSKFACDLTLRFNGAWGVPLVLIPLLFPNHPLPYNLSIISTNNNMTSEATEMRLCLSNSDARYAEREIGMWLVFLGILTSDDGLQ